MTAIICERCDMLDDPDRDQPCACTAWRLTSGSKPQQAERPPSRPPVRKVGDVPLIDVIAAVAIERQRRAA